MPDRARIVATPREDVAFAASAELLAERIPPALDDEAARDWLQTHLRRSYPNAVVREQDALARTADEPVWYVTNRLRLSRIDTSVIVPLLPAEAFDVYVDRVVEWQTAVELEPMAEAPAAGGRPGHAYRAWYSLLGRRFSGTLRIVAADRPRLVTVEAEGSGIAVWYVTRFQPRRDRSRTLVTVEGDYDLPDTIIARVADRLFLERAIARDIDGANASYRALCESIAASRPVR